MKKLVLALAATAAFAGQAIAADMPARVAKAPPPIVAPVPTWTGCYIAGGGGGAMTNQEVQQFDVGPPRTAISDPWTNGGRGWFGTVQGGCDYQFSQFVIGAFADYDFMDVTGRWGQTNSGRTGAEKLSSQWAVGGRVGWVALPGLLTYFTGGYTEATYDRFTFGQFLDPQDRFIPGQTYKGWFVGAGDEFALTFLPGLFWKTEYRFSRFDTSTVQSFILATGAPSINNYDFKKYEHSVRTELVWRFNWGGAGPVVARY